MTTVQIQIPDRQAAALDLYAQANGLTVEQCILQLVEKAAPVQPSESTAQAAIDDRPIWEIFVDSIKEIPEEIMATLPKDGASQHDHYIYGWPKKEE